jgi:hypothetical protein
MSDTATVLIAIGPAAITALVAYFAARFQRDTSKAETEATTLRIRIEHDEAKRSHRQGVYHNFLILLVELAGMMKGFAPLDEARLQGWLASFYAQSQGLQLYGAQGMRDALTPLGGAIGEALVEAEKGDKRLPLYERMKVAYGRHEGEIVVATIELTEEMREDVAPEMVDPLIRELREAQGQRSD